MLKTRVAKRYAQALFDHMPGKKELFKCLATLDQTALTPHDFWHNPTMKSSQYLDFFKITGKSFKAPKAWVSFGNVLLDNKRISLMPFIITEYLKLCEKNVQVIITTAAPFSTQEQKKLIHWVKQKTEARVGKKIDPVLAVDATLLAGFKVESDTFVYDATLKHQLQTLEKALL